jgi:AraC-like DNA-binding protein
VPATAPPANIDVWHVPQFDGLVFYRGTNVSHPYPRHWHDELHLCAYTAGYGYLGYRGAAHLGGAGDFILTPAGEVHSNWVTEPPGVSFRSVYVDLRVLRSHAVQVSGRDCVPDFSSIQLRSPAAQQAFLRMHRVMEDADSELLREELLAACFGVLIAECSDLRCPPLRPGREHAVVQRVRRYIEQHSHENISLAELARIARLSAFRLHHVFSQTIGVPPHRYQLQCRINRSKEMLRQSRDLSEVALATGFADQSHFTRHFVRLVGVTPGDFRAR